MFRLEDLSLFVRAAALGSFSEAAREAGIPPAQVSSAIKRLETALNIRLFARSTRSLRLTVEGETWLPYALQMLDALQNGLQQINTPNDEVSGTPQQSQTNNALNDVAWNGTTLVTVGDQGTILSSQNGVADGWTDISSPAINLSLAAVAVDSNSDQFLIVGASSTVLIGDGTTNSWQSATSVPLALNLEDVVWLNPGYVAVGKNGSIITSNDGDTWTLQNSGLSITITLKAVASNGSIIVAVGTNGTILTSTGGVAWQAQPAMVNNDLNDISWDGQQFGVVGSNDTILTSPDGVTWTSHIPGTPNITFVAATQWDSSLPANPVLGAVGSAGTYVVSPNATTGFSVPTGTTQQLSGMTWVDDNVSPPYFVMVGNDGTVLTSQLQLP